MNIHSTSVSICKRSADVSLQHDNILHSKGFSNTICTHDYCCIYPNNSCSWCFYKGEINDNALVSYQMKTPSIILYECSHMLIPLRNSLVNKTKAVASTVRGWCMQRVCLIPALSSKLQFIVLFLCIFDLVFTRLYKLSAATSIWLSSDSLSSSSWISSSDDNLFRTFNALWQARLIMCARHLTW